MSIEKRGDNWWIRFTKPNGERVQISAKTAIKQQAQELHDRLKSEAWRIDSIGDKPSYTWEQAVVRWINEHQHKKSLVDDKMHLRYLDGFFSGYALANITRSKIEQVKQAKIDSGASCATVNRLLAVIRAILNIAHKDWQWLDSVPPMKPMIEPPARIRWLTHDEADRLLKELPPHVKVMAQFALATGLRESNVRLLQWSNIDIQRRCCWVDSSASKNGKAIFVPLNQDALNAIRSQIGKNRDYVFTYQGKPVCQVGVRAWRKALKRAGIDNFRWHDLRHTWASWHVQAGTPLNVLKELGGWSDLSMVMRYAHLSNDHLAGYADSVTVKKRATG